MKNKFFKNKKNKIEMQSKSSGRNNNHSFNYGDMPVEIALYLSSFFKFNDAASIMRTNKFWHDVICGEFDEDGEIRKSLPRFTLYDPLVDKKIVGSYSELSELINLRKEMIAVPPSFILNLMKLINQIKAIITKEKFSLFAPATVGLFFSALFVFSLWAGPESFFIYKGATSERITTCENKTLPIRNSTLGPIEGYKNVTVCNTPLTPFEMAALLYGILGGLALPAIAIFLLVLSCATYCMRDKFVLSAEQRRSLDLQLNTIAEEVKKRDPSTSSRLQSELQAVFRNKDARGKNLKKLKESLVNIKKSYKETIRLCMFQQPKDEAVTNREEVTVRIAP